MYGGTELSGREESIGASIEKLFKQFLLQQFEAFARFTHRGKIGRNLLGAVAGKNQRQISISGLNARQCSQGGAAKIFEGVVCHD